MSKEAPPDNDEPTDHERAFYYAETGRLPDDEDFDV